MIRLLFPNQIRRHYSCNCSLSVDIITIVTALVLLSLHVEFAVAEDKTVDACKNVVITVFDQVVTRDCEFIYTTLYEETDYGSVTTRKISSRLLVSNAERLCEKHFRSRYQQELNEVNVRKWCLNRARITGETDEEIKKDKERTLDFLKLILDYRRSKTDSDIVAEKVFQRTAQRTKDGKQTRLSDVLPDKQSRKEWLEEQISNLSSIKVIEEKIAQISTDPIVYYYQEAAIPNLAWRAALQNYFGEDILKIGSTEVKKLSQLAEQAGLKHAKDKDLIYWECQNRRVEELKAKLLLKLVDIGEIRLCDEVLEERVKNRLKVEIDHSNR